MESVFTKIITGQIPAYKIAEDEMYLAFLDVNPLVEGHTLVIPKKQVDYIFDLEEDVFAGLHLFSRRVAVALEKAIPCQRIGVTVIGLEVPHAHIHLIPLNGMGDMNFSHPKLKLSPERFAEIAGDIKSHF